MPKGTELLGQEPRFYLPKAPNR